MRHSVCSPNMTANLGYCLASYYTNSPYVDPVVIGISIIHFQLQAWRDDHKCH